MPDSLAFEYVADREGEGGAGDPWCPDQRFENVSRRDTLYHGILRQNSQTHRHTGLPAVSDSIHHTYIIAFRVSGRVSQHNASLQCMIGAAVVEV